MFYKLSNTSKIADLEDYFDVPLKYPNLYKEQSIIDGLSENNLLVRTLESPDELQFAIWGLLPEDYTGSWEHFQKIKNTLNYNTDIIKTDQCFKSALYQRRCLILITGFFTTYLIDGKLFPFYVHLTSGKPFCLAGIYTQLSDGFITCSVLVSNNAQSINKIQNLGCEVPVMLNKPDSYRWINEELEKNDVDEIIDNPQSFLYEVHPVSDALYKDNFSTSSILEPVKYKELPSFT